MRMYDIESLYIRRVERLLMQMYWHKNDAEYIDTARPDMRLRNHDGTKFKIKTTQNHMVYTSIIGVYSSGNGFQFILKHRSKSDFRRCIRENACWLTILYELVAICVDFEV